VRKPPQCEENRRCRSVRKPPQSEDDAEAAEAGRGGLIPDCGMPYLEPFERSVEWSPALKVLTGHKNGAPTPRKPNYKRIIKCFNNYKHMAFRIIKF
jgi:hypothetical protein